MHYVRTTTNVPDRCIDRYYDPSTDQFLSVDPDLAETGQPYAFTGDDPLNATDPLGLKPLSVYVIRNLKTGKIEYVGKTKRDVAVREKEHGRGPNRRITDPKEQRAERLSTPDDLTAEQQTGLEQVLIENVPDLSNKYNSISPNNPAYDQTVKAGLGVIADNPDIAQETGMPDLFQMAITDDALGVAPGAPPPSFGGTAPDDDVVVPEP